MSITKYFIIILTLGINLIIHSQTNSEVLSKLISFKSTSGHEKEAMLYLKSICEKHNLVVKIFSDSDSSYNFCASIFPLSTKKPNIVLLNHIDVVEANSTEWLHHPFEGKIINDTIWGRGALDMKGMAVMQLFAMLQLNKDSLTHNITLLCVSGEESGGKNGAKIICDNFSQELNPVLVLGEGGAGLKGAVPGNKDKTVFFVSTAEKRSLWIKLEAKVKSHGHAAIPANKSANKLILKAIEKIENHKPKIKFDKTTKTTFKQLGRLIPGYKGFILSHVNWFIFKPLRYKVLSQNELLLPMVQNTFQLTRIGNPQGSINQIPSISEAYFDARLLPRFGEKPFAIKRLMRSIDPRIKLSIIDESPEAEPSKMNGYYYKLKNSIETNYPNSSVIPFLFLASSDNSYFRNKGITTFGVMPIIMNEELLNSVHATNERISINQLNKGTNVYLNFLKNLN